MMRVGRRRLQHGFCPFAENASTEVSRLEISRSSILGIVRQSAEALARIPVGDISNRPRPAISGRVGILGTLETLSESGTDP
jgi:hypothetical protein